MLDAGTAGGRYQDKKQGIHWRGGGQEGCEQIQCACQGAAGVHKVAWGRLSSGCGKHHRGAGV